MKKKVVTSKLRFTKNVISNLQSKNLRGGTDVIVYGVTYVIVNTIKITRDIYTTPEVCDGNSERCTTIPPTCTTCLDC